MCVKWKDVAKPIRIHRIVSSIRVRIQRRSRISVNSHPATNDTRTHRRCESMWKPSSTLYKRSKSTIQRINLRRQQRPPLKRCHRYFARNRQRSHADNPNTVCRLWGRAAAVVSNPRVHFTIIIKRISFKIHRWAHHRPHTLHQRCSYPTMDCPATIHVYRQCTQNATTPHQLHPCTI